jgi:hypothetical protein
MPGYILTGTPGSGKTAVLRMLETVGYPVVEEAATDVIALNQALGRDQPWDEPAFIDNIVALQRRRQDRALTGGDGEIVFFDRSPVHAGAQPLRRPGRLAVARPRGGPRRVGRQLRQDGLLHQEPGFRGGHRGQADQLRRLAYVRAHPRADLP